MTTKKELLRRIELLEQRYLSLEHQVATLRLSPVTLPPQPQWVPQPAWPPSILPQPPIITCDEHGGIQVQQRPGLSWNGDVVCWRNLAPNAEPPLCGVRSTTVRFS